MLYHITVPQFIKMLHNLDHILNKAETHSKDKKFEMDVLLNTRLTPNMFSFTRQIQIACDTAKLCASRLSGTDAPVNDDSEKTLLELRNRIHQTVTYLQSFSEGDFEGAESRHITQPRWEGKYLTGTEFTLQHAIPNLYFHISMAYAILRSHGIEIGKKDYLGEMPYKK